MGYIFNLLVWQKTTIPPRQLHTTLYFVEFLGLHYANPSKRRCPPPPPLKKKAHKIKHKIKSQGTPP